MYGDAAFIPDNGNNQILSFAHKIYYNIYIVEWKINVGANK